MGLSHVSPLTAALVAANTILVLHVIRPSTFRTAVRWMQRLLWRRLPFNSDAELAKLLGRDYTPPLPGPVAQALDRACLCFLATADNPSINDTSGSPARSQVSPHLSLMRFSYCASLSEEASEVLIMSTRRDTKKFLQLTRNKNVALLVHDFSSSDEANYAPGDDGGSKFSITLNGTVEVQQGALAERYRAIHLARNQAYSQFIVGDAIAMVTVRLQSARICDVNDSVRRWEKSDAGQAWAEVTPSKPAPRFLGT